MVSNKRDEQNFDVTPMGMMNNGRIWRELYYQNIIGDINRQIVAVYCLLISVEMYGKAYLIFYNKKYSKSEELKKSIGHSLKKLGTILAQTKECNGIAKNFKKAIEKFDLDKYDDISFLRYPEKGDTFSFSAKYFDPNNNLIKLTLYIENEINQFFIENWLGK